MGVANQALSALRRMGLVVLIAVVFLFGLASTVYLSLRSPETTVPKVVGLDRYEAERILGEADLNFRVRATRPSNQVAADTVLFQLPRAGEVVKTGQTVAMDVSRAAKEGEASEAVVNDKKASEERVLENRNANTSAASRNDNENRPKRNRNINKNSNENTNTRRPRTITNTANSNSAAVGANSNESPSRTVNQNINRRPSAPKPTPTRENNDRKKR